MFVAGDAESGSGGYFVPLEDAFAFENFKVGEWDGGVPGLSKKTCLASAGDFRGKVVLEHFVDFSRTECIFWCVLWMVSFRVGKSLEFSSHPLIGIS